ncbi:hypothetical protein HPB50_019008 [Hyalomma asiaticum]|uniref:Uncharacterized protein n=1 Tax=Hyalomma asiaticum TaxID=266040 RepID=A0ACB7S140_HYAAI|nr:hypothetical protein HPB50_019008 [Hyalomma asiaticum]
MGHKSVVYVHAASGKSGAAVASVVDGQGAPVSGATIRSRNTETAEELAVARACVGTKAHFIISDSKTAIWNFRKGRISPEAARVLSGRRLNKRLVEFGAKHTRPFLTTRRPPPDCQNMDELLQSYTEITENYRLFRRVVPPPDKSLNNKEALAWWRLQAGNVVNPRCLGSPAADRGPRFTATSHPPGGRSREESRPLSLLLIAEVPAPSPRPGGGE